MKTTIITNLNKIFQNLTTNPTKKSTRMKKVGTQCVLGRSLVETQFNKPKGDKVSTLGFVKKKAVISLF